MIRRLIRELVRERFGPLSMVERERWAPKPPPPVNLPPGRNLRKVRRALPTEGAT